MKKYASEYYKNKHGNCGQAVAAAWHKKTAQHGDLIEKLSSCGGGKAPEGFCGALYAAHCVVDKDSAEKITDSFSKAAGGHTKCKAIRSAKSLPCAECVEVAAGLLDEHLESLQNTTK